MPHFVREDSLANYEEELGMLRDAVAEHFSVTVDDRALDKAIAAQQEIMGLVRSMYEMRERGEPAVTGTEALTMVTLSSSMPAETFGALLAEFLEDRSAGEGWGISGPG